MSFNTQIGKTIPTVDLSKSNSFAAMLNELNAVREIKSEAERRERELKAAMQALSGTDGEAILLAADGRKLVISEYTRNIKAKAAYVQHCKSYTVEG